MKFSQKSGHKPIDLMNPLKLTASNVGFLISIAMFFWSAAIAQVTVHGDKSLPHDLELRKYFPQKINHLAQPYDVTFYHLKLDVRPDVQQIAGSVQIDGFSQAANLRDLAIDLYDNMIVDSVTSNDVSLQFSRVVQQVVVQLPQALSARERFSITVHYRGNPQRIGFGSFNWTESNGTPRIWTLSEPYGAPTWWPCKDDPADKADSVFLDITVPENLVAASNGSLVRTDIAPNQRKTWVWKTRYPISTYLVVLAIADYTRYSDTYFSGGAEMPVEYFVYPELLDAAQIDFAPTIDMLSAFSALFGEYPFFSEKYGMASVTSGASMEHQTLTTLAARHINGAHTGEWAIAHELAHHWFGDLITLKNWPDIWLHEGFASYCEALWEESVRGDSAYVSAMRNMDPGSFSGTVVVTDTVNLPVMFSATVYRKGAWVLHMLRGVLGDAVFFDALNAFATDPRWQFGNATTLDFVRTCEQISGKDLTWFFEQWLFRVGRPVYDYHWDVSGDAAPYQTTLRIDQMNSQPYENNLPYRMPLQVRLSAGNETQTVTIWDSLPEQQFVFETDFSPANLEIDPDNWVLKRLIFNGGNISSIPRGFEIAQNFPNPFNGTTIIRYGILRRTAVTVTIFNVRGQQVFAQNLPPQVVGFYDFIWDGKDNNGRDLPSGIYYYQFSDGNSSAAKKLVLVR